MASQHSTGTRQKRCAVLVDKIVEIFDKGLALDQDAMQYIDTTFSHPCAEELQRILHQASDSESDSAIALVFFPDDMFCEQLEDLLATFDFEASDEKSIMADLASRHIITTLDLPKNRGSLSVAMPPHAIAQFISCLNISVKIDSLLIKAIDGCIEPARRRLCKVKLRHARFDQTEEKRSFLRRFFETVKNDGDFFRRFDFILNFLTEVPDTGDVFGALMRRKRFYIKNLQRILALEEQTRGKNMETLIQQGLQVPYLNKRDVGKKIGWIDEISLAVFGKTDYFGAPGDSVSLELDTAGQDIGRIAKILS
jgi:hypothetical protein